MYDWTVIPRQTLSHTTDLWNKDQLTLGPPLHAVVVSNEIERKVPVIHTLLVRHSENGCNQRSLHGHEPVITRAIVSDGKAAKAVEGHRIASKQSEGALGP